jgi:hypothetical protein
LQRQLQRFDIQFGKQVTRLNAVTFLDMQRRDPSADLEAGCYARLRLNCTRSPSNRALVRPSDH